mgnify:CR=1 FL=1
MQNKEIELKFGFCGDALNLYSIFSNIGKVSDETDINLDNTYYDTDTRDFYSIRAGLRIRRSNDFSEQTLKIKGENIGGLHKRSEYNLPIDPSAELPTLQKFPKEAFPENFDLEDIQSRLRSICRINFTRHLFNLEFMDSTFEVAYDRGYIETMEDFRHSLNELEIELKQTNVKPEEILNLFSILCTALAKANLPLQLEPFSKMHRATLLQKNTLPSIDISCLDNSKHIVDYITSLVSVFEIIYGHFLVSHEVSLFSVNCTILNLLLHSLKQLRHKNLFAFIIGRTEPVEYKEDLEVIIKLLKSFYQDCLDCRKKMIIGRLKGKTETVEKCVDKIRKSERQNKMFMIPLKLRLLLSLIAK